MTLVQFTEIFKEEMPGMDLSDAEILRWWLIYERIKHREQELQPV